MDQASARDFSASMSSQIPTSYTQGNRQHVNISQSQDSMYTLSHSRPQSRQQQDVSQDSNRQDLSSSIQHNLINNKNVSSQFSNYPENYTHLQPSPHDQAQGVSKQPDLSGQANRQQSLEYSHRNSPIDTKYQGSNYSASQTAVHKQTYSTTQNHQQHKIDRSQAERQEFTKDNYSEESQNPSELYYEHQIKKDSEIKLTNSDIQYLANAENQSNLYGREGNNQSNSGNTSSPAETTVSQSSDSKTKSQTLHLQADRTHVCLTCFKTFKNKPQLTQHELVHNGIRKHTCMYCDKAFKQICHLNQHTRVHTGERPYKCTVEGCGRAFAQLSNLNHHMKNHEDHVRRDISKQYRCEVCDRSYANQNSLHTHIQKLHMNLKAAEGSTTHPITQSSPTKKRKKKNKQQAQLLPESTTLASQESIQQHYMLNFSDSDDDGLPTQVRTKSLAGPKTGAVGKPIPSQAVEKNHIGQKITLPVSLPQTHQMSFSEKLPDLQHFTQIKTEHREVHVLEQTGHVRDNGETQLSQTYSPGHTPPTTTKPDKLQQRDVHPAPQQRDITRTVNTNAITTNGSQVSNAIPFLIHSSPNITSPPIPSTLFSSLQPLSLPQSVADSLPSHIRHHFPDVVTSSQLERDSRHAAAQNFFHPAFTDQNMKSESNRFR